MTNCYLVSDLHLFSRRSTGFAHEQRIWQIAAAADIFVLAGDIFDFQWTTLETVEETVQAAVAWLDGLVGTFTDCQFYYVLGNHDHNELFMEELDRLQFTYANFAWHPFYLRLGDSLFLHGDMAGRRMDPQRLARNRYRWSRAKKKKAWHGAVYNAIAWTQVQRFVPRIVAPRRRAAKRILAYLDAIGHSPDSGVRHVYYGHTHVPLSGYEYGGTFFYNCGAPMHGFDFQILQAEISSAHTPIGLTREPL